MNSSPNSNNNQNSNNKDCPLKNNNHGNEAKQAELHWQTALKRVNLADFPSPNGNAAKRAKSLEQKLKLQKCLNRLNKNCKQLELDYKQAQQQIKRLKDLLKLTQGANATICANDEYLADDHRLNSYNQDKHRPYNHTQAPEYYLKQGLAKLQQRLAEIKLRHTPCQHKNNKISQQITQTLKHLPQNFRQTISELEQEKLNLNQQFHQHEQANADIETISNKIALLDKQEADYFQQLQQQITDAENQSKQSEQLINDIKTLTIEATQQTHQLQQTLAPANTEQAQSFQQNPNDTQQLLDLLHNIEHCQSEIEQIQNHTRSLRENYQTLKIDSESQTQQAKNLQQDTQALKRETKLLRDSKASFEQEISSLRNEANQFNSDYETFKSKLVTKEDLKLLLQDERALYQDNTLELETNHSILEGKLDAIEQYAFQSKSDLIKLAEQIQSNACHSEHALEKTSQLSQEIETLKQKTEKISTAIDPLKYSQQQQLEESRALIQQLKIFAKENQQLSDQISQGIDRDEGLEKDLQNLKLEIEQTRSHAQHIDQKNSAIDNQQAQKIDQLQQRLEQIQQSITINQADRSNYNSTLQACDLLEQDLNQTLKDGKLLIGNLEANYKSQLDNIARLENQHDRADEIILDLTEIKLFAQTIVNKNHSLNEALSRQIQPVEKKVERLNLLERNAQHSVSNIEIIAHDADQALINLQSTQANSLKQQEEIRLLQNKSKALISQLTQQLKCSEISLAESSQKAEHLDQLVDSTQALHQQSQLVAENQQALNKESQRLHQETNQELALLGELKSEIQQLSKNIQHEKIEIDQYKTSYQSMAGQHQQAVSELALDKKLQEKTIQESKNQIAATETKLEQLTQLQDQYKDQIEQLQNQLSHANKSLKDSQKIIEQAKHASEKLDQNQSNYQNSLDAFNQTQQQFINAIETLQNHQPLSSPLTLKDLNWHHLQQDYPRNPPPWYKEPQGLLLAIVILISLCSTALIVFNQTSPQWGHIDSSHSQSPAVAKNGTADFGKRPLSAPKNSLDEMLALVMSNESSWAEKKTALQTIILRANYPPLQSWASEELNRLGTLVASQSHNPDQPQISQGDQANPYPREGRPPFTWPLKAQSPNPAAISYTRFRQGITITAAVGHPVVSISDGKVIFSGKDVLGKGNLILIQHPNQYISIYGNSQTANIEVGQQVHQGQTIAKVGSQFSNDPPSLYFEIRYKGQPEDPFYYFSNS